ncbi:MAG: 4-alpha-glucanotransferase [Candidatus Omnitrophica bacterium]|nr:4-alpha-glucanotransferase [Candidatus Omnitrophota bacterium]
MSEPLDELARLLGVESSYWDARGRLHHASQETLFMILSALGVPLSGIKDLPGALRGCRLFLWKNLLEPVHLVWEEEPLQIPIRLPDTLEGCSLEAELRFESGRRRRFSLRTSDLGTVESAEIEGVRYRMKSLSLPGRLPMGYHSLKIRVGKESASSLLLSAPRKVYEAGHRKRWGLFIPLYALHSRNSWGGGDFSDLARLIRGVSPLGAGFVGTLPLLASFLDEPFEPCPYLPVSRLFWNEFYLDLSSVPELKRSASARRLIGSPGFQREIRSLRQKRQVDYRRQMALKRKVLSELCGVFFRTPARREKLERFLAKNPDWEKYARFRKDFRYHLYAQWLCREQMGRLCALGRRSGAGLYLDWPLGTHPAGYDLFSRKPLFAVGASAGAPPDPFFSGGQDWGFPPLHPVNIRREGYRYWIESLRHSMKVSELLRIDHVMGLHRLFWIPHGAPAREGTYVRYRPEEFYAILSIESHRWKTTLIGEDLGTLPEELRPAMRSHALLGMHVVQFEAKGDLRALAQPPAESIASLNTHDTPTFAAFLREKHLLRERDSFGEILRRCLLGLARGGARFLLVSLEDLWGEVRAQNRPGTGRRYSNWRRKARVPLESFLKNPSLLGTLREIGRLRGGA